MLPLIRAEYRKLFTIRSTYIMLIIATLLIGFISFWVLGYKAQASGSDILVEAATTGANTIAIFLALIAVLLITHEYRYNTIMYTLTASNSRSKVLGAKLLVVLGFAAVATLAAMVFAAFAVWLGVVVSGNPMMTQYIQLWDVLWRGLFYALAWTAVGLLLGVLFRHVVGAIITLFIVPSTVEGLLSLLLKDNTKYLPFTALENVSTGGALSPGKAALIFGAYLLVGWAAAWYLFLKRDAN